MVVKNVLLGGQKKHAAIREMVEANRLGERKVYKVEVFRTTDSQDKTGSLNAVSWVQGTCLKHLPDMPH